MKSEGRTTKNEDRSSDRPVADPCLVFLTFRNPRSARRSLIPALRGLALGALPIALCFLTGCALLPRRDAPERTVVITQPAEVPARILANFFIIESRQDDGQVRRFLIDTGSSATLVSPEFAAAVKLKEKGKARRVARVRGAHGAEAELEAVTLRKLWLGEVAVERVPALVYGFAELSHHLGLQVDGVVGFPIFRDLLLTLDYPRARLVLAPVPAQPAALRASDRATTLAFNADAGTPLIPVQLGAESFIVLIDTGSYGSLNLNPAGLHPRFVSGPRPGKIVSGLGSDRQQLVGRLAQDLLIGGHVVEQPVADLTDQLSALGGELLKHYALTFDQRRRHVTFARDAAGPVVMEARRDTGLSFDRSPAYWRVLGLVPETPVTRTRLQPGDLCVRINGEPVDKWDYERYAALLRTAPRITYTFLSGATESDYELPVIELVP